MAKKRCNARIRGRTFRSGPEPNQDEIQSEHQFSAQHSQEEAYRDSRAHCTTSLRGTSSLYFVSPLVSRNGFVSFRVRRLVQRPPAATRGGQKCIQDIHRSHLIYPPPPTPLACPLNHYRHQPRELPTGTCTQVYDNIHLYIILLIIYIELVIYSEIMQLPILQCSRKIVKSQEN